MAKRTGFIMLLLLLLAACSEAPKRSLDLTGTIQDSREYLTLRASTGLPKGESFTIVFKETGEKEVTKEMKTTEEGKLSVRFARISDDNGPDEGGVIHVMYEGNENIEQSAFEITFTSLDRTLTNEFKFDSENDSSIKKITPTD
ncbi:hypothetical protein FZW96_00340 [Bacillus sp. BGMRC 2118]|nr:hypothetical protein FZW96_00340 [Bacillus sp. BGMRC 2118]